MPEDSALLHLFEQRGILLRPVPSPSQYDHIRVYWLDLANLLTLNGAADVIFYVISPAIVLDEDGAALIEEIIQTSNSTDMLKVLEYSSVTEAGLRILSRIPKLAAFSRSELAGIRKTEPLKRHFIRRFTSTSALSSLNPYTFQGPVTNTRFFGRDNELSTLRLQAEKSFVISGMRRSGKTSLMMEFSRRLQASKSDDIVIFVNFETCQSLQDIASKVLFQLSEQLRGGSARLSVRSDDLLHLSNSRMWARVSNLPKIANTIWKLITSSDEIGRLRFLFDEYDRVVALERPYDYVFTRTWRDLVMRPSARMRQGGGFSGFPQFVFAGTRKLYEEILSEKSPLHNLAARLSLPNFDIQTLTDLVTKPMREIGVAVHDPANVAQTVLKITGGHPATTQHLCSLVIDDPQVDKMREVTADSIQRAGRNPKFLGLFKNNIERNVSPMGRFILAQMAINNRDTVNVHFLRDSARKYRVQFVESDLNVALEDLADSGYLRGVDFAEGHTVYRLAVPTIPLVFSVTDADDLIVDMLADGVCRRA